MARFRHQSIKQSRAAINGSKWSGSTHLAFRRPALRLLGIPRTFREARGDVVADISYPVPDNGDVSWSCAVHMFERRYVIHGVDAAQALALSEWFVADHMKYEGFRVSERQRFIRFRPGRIKPVTPDFPALAHRLRRMPQRP